MDFDRLLSYSYSNNDLIVEHLAKTDEGFPMISSVRSPNAIYPSLTFTSIGGGDVRFADDNPFTERAVYEIDLYGNGVPYEVKDEIKKVFNSIGFFLIHKATVKNVYTNITHNLWHVKTTMNQEMYDYYMKQQEEIFKIKNKFTNHLPDGDYYDENSGKEYKVRDNKIVRGRESIDIEDLQGSNRTVVNGIELID